MQEKFSGAAKQSYRLPTDAYGREHDAAYLACLCQASFLFAYDPCLYASRRGGWLCRWGECFMLAARRQQAVLSSMIRAGSLTRSVRRARENRSLAPFLISTRLNIHLTPALTQLHCFSLLVRGTTPWRGGQAFSAMLCQVRNVVSQS